MRALFISLKKNGCGQDIQETKMDKDAEIARLNLVIANQAEAYQEQMRAEIGKLRKRLEYLEQAIESYTQIINVYRMMGKK